MITYLQRNETQKGTPQPRRSPVSSTPIKSNGHIDEEWDAEGQSEQVAQLLSQLSKSRAQCNRDERRITELEEQLATVIQQNQALENQVVQLSHRGEEGMKSMHEELTTLEEVRLVLFIKILLLKISKRCKRTV